ncbi:MAG: response regulator transcription factor [Lewinella sp.]|nr:response regulator transcription factor [Lewinella sp.]
MSQSPHLLLVEDDMNLGFLLMEFLELNGLAVTWRRDGLAGLKSLGQSPFDLCLLDIGMPGMDGFNLAKHLRERHPRTPFLFLTARLLKEDKLKGYALGADDYITKPFDEEELLCKIRVILRRRGEEEQPVEQREFRIGDYTFHVDRQELCRDEEVQRLTEKENEVLYLLCQHRNRILRRADAVEAIYGKDDYFLGRSFDVYISRLRKILSGDPAVSIENVYKVGFILNVPD